MPTISKGKRIDDAITEWITSTEFETVGFYIPEQDIRDWCRGSLSFFRMSMNSLYGVSTLDAISFEHIGTFYCISRQMHASGQWEELVTYLGKSPNKYVPKLEELLEYVNLQTEILKRFLAFCWAQEYIGKQYLTWHWTPEEFEKAARLKQAYVVPKSTPL